MTVTEQARHRLHAHLEEIMGEEHAAALMEWVPNGPVASKDDIDRLREVMDLRFEAVNERFATVATTADLHNTIRVHTIVLVGALGTMISIARIF